MMDDRRERIVAAAGIWQPVEGGQWRGPIDLPERMERALRAAAEAQYRYDEPSALREDEEHEIEVSISAGIRALSGEG